MKRVSNEKFDLMYKLLVDQIESDGGHFYLYEEITGVVYLGHREVAGHYDASDNKTINIFVGRKAPLWKIIWVIAHEYRHLQHDKLGMFKSYFTNFENAWKSEVDCENYAYNFCRRWDINVKRSDYLYKTSHKLKFKKKWDKWLKQG